MYGPEDHFTNNLSRLIRSSFGVFPIPSGGRTVVQPVWVEDLATCILWSLEKEDTLNQVYELGGSEFFTLQQIIETIMETTHRKRFLVPLSPITLRALTVFFEGVIPNFPISSFWLDYFAVNRTCAVDSMPRIFGLMPARFTYRLDYLIRKPWYQRAWNAVAERVCVSCVRVNLCSNFTIRLIETPEEMRLVEELQRVVWPDSETDVVPLHMLITAVHNGGLVLGAFVEEKMIGFVFGFPGLDTTPDGPRPKHCSHMMGIHPDHRDGGVGFALKRAQWQMVRHQGLDHITWTYDPLLSRNAYLNIAKLGAVCVTYRRSEYGDMRDGLNAGLPSDRFQVDWWINTQRVQKQTGQTSRAPRSS